MKGLLEKAEVKNVLICYCDQASLAQYKPGLNHCSIQLGIGPEIKILDPCIAVKFKKYTDVISDAIGDSGIFRLRSSFYTYMYLSP